VIVRKKVIFVTKMCTKRTLLRLLLRKSNVSTNSSSSISFRASSSLSITSLTDQFTFSSSGLPRVKEVHHPNRVKDNVLHPAFDIVIPEVIQLGCSDWILLTKNYTFAFSKTFQITYCEFLWSNIAMHGHLPGVWPFLIIIIDLKIPVIILQSTFMDTKSALSAMAASPNIFMPSLTPLASNFLAHLGLCQALFAE